MASSSNTSDTIVRLVAPDGWFLHRAAHEHTSIMYRGDVHEPLPHAAGAWVVEFQRYPTGGLLTVGRGQNLCEAWVNAVTAVEARAPTRRHQAGGLIMRKTIHAILKHFDLSRKPTQVQIPPPSELIIFHDHYAARRAGFRGASHPNAPHLLAWWPGLGAQGLLCRSPQRITVPTTILHLNVNAEGSLYDLLRKRQVSWGDKAIWIEV